MGCGGKQPSSLPTAPLLMVLLFLFHSSHLQAAGATEATPPSTPHHQYILVVGSLNIDIIIDVSRLPTNGETLVASSPSPSYATGGKGANQAVAAARLSADTGRTVRFVGRFGNDSHAAAMEAALRQESVDVSGCKRVELPSGQGLVLLQPDGTATSVVVAGANAAFDKEPPAALAHLMRGTGVVMLQREVPEHVNEAVAAAAAAEGVPVLLDIGGEERPISDSLLKLVDYVCPNESELARLTGLPTAREDEAVAAAASLIKRGAKRVLVTLAERGALLVGEDGSVLKQAALLVPGGAVADGTAAGDAFRAAFAVALVEGRQPQECLRFAAAAGAISVSRMGAVPSLPRRAETMGLAAAGGAEGAGTGGQEKGAVTRQQEEAEPQEKKTQPAAFLRASAGGSSNACGKDGGSSQATCSAATQALPPAACPYQFASRLNSMHARRDLLAAGQGAASGDSVLGWIARQGLVKGLSLVDLNHPQHTTGSGLSQEELRAALGAAGLAAGAVCMRYPEAFALGAFSYPDAAVRRQAVELSVEGCRWAAELGASDLIIWSSWDGYDYHFQMDYHAAWQRSVESLRQLADACPAGVHVSLEFKPTDEATRYAVVPSTGAALLLVRDVDRPNFGLTLDVGHMLMAGENPAQSVAMVGGAGKLFGVQLNDAHVRLGAEDGLAFGSVNPIAALEMVRWLQRVKYDGHIYFDTFPRKEDPVREAEYNIRRFKALWSRAARLAAAAIDQFADIHDALGALELLEKDEGLAAA